MNKLLSLQKRVVNGEMYLFVAQAALSSLRVSQTISLVTLALLIFYKFYYEGMRPGSYTMVLTSIVFPFLPHPMTLVCSAVTSLLYYYFPVYEFPMPTGFFSVGIVESKLKGNHLSIFFPAKEDTNQRANFLSNGIDHFDREEKVNKLFGLFTNSLYMKLYLKFFGAFKIHASLGAEIISNDEHGSDSFPVIIFSHGIGCHSNSLSVICSEWASYGYIVISINHDDEVLSPSGNLEDFSHRNKDLKKRYENVRDVLDFVYTKEFDWNAMLHGEDVKINYQKICIAGYSYGGGTAIYSAIREPKRITGFCIALDPWLYPIDENELKKISNKILIVRTKQMEFITPNNMKNLKMFCSLQNESNLLVGYLNEASHSNFMDNSILLPRELSLRKWLVFAEIGQNLRNILSITEAFMTNASNKEGDFTAEDTQKILDKYKNQQPDHKFRFVKEVF